MRAVNLFRKGMGDPRSADGRAALASVDKKFHPGATPIEREPFEDVLKPQYREQLEQMMKLMGDYAQQAGTPEAKQAVALWQAQVAQGTFSDKVKFEWARRFYYWLLGRGTEEDHDRTMWGRGNAAVYNPQVRAYIESFGAKRLQFAQQLALLANRVPDTLTGYYLYFKYIVGGKLERKTKGGQSWWDMSDEDFLADFEMFHNEFAADRDYIAKPFANGAKIGPEPFPSTPAQKGADQLHSFSAHSGPDARITQAARDQVVMQNMNARQNPVDAEHAEEGTDAAAMEAVSGGSFISPQGARHHSVHRAARRDLERELDKEAPPTHFKRAVERMDTSDLQSPSETRGLPPPPGMKAAEEVLREAEADPVGSAERQAKLQVAQTFIHQAEADLKELEVREDVAANDNNASPATRAKTAALATPATVPNTEFATPSTPDTVLNTPATVPNEELDQTRSLEGTPENAQKRLADVRSEAYWLREMALAAPPKSAKKLRNLAEEFDKVAGELEHEIKRKQVAANIR